MPTSPIMGLRVIVVTIDAIVTMVESDIPGISAVTVAPPGVLPAVRTTEAFP